MNFPLMEKCSVRVGVGGQNIILSTSYMTDEEHKAGKVHIVTQEATNLFSELFFAQFVESEKLLSKNNVLDEATRS